MHPHKIIIKALNFEKISLNLSKNNHFATQRSCSKKTSGKEDTSPPHQSSIKKNKINLNIVPKSTLNLLSNKHIQLSRNRDNSYQNNIFTNTFSGRGNATKKILSSTINTNNNNSNLSYRNFGKNINKKTISSFTLYKNINSNSLTSRNNKKKGNLSNRFYTVINTNPNSSINNSNSITNSTFGQNYFNNTSANITLSSNHNRANKTNSVLKSSLKKNKIYIKENSIMTISSGSNNSKRKDHGKYSIIDKKKRFIQKEAENLIMKDVREKIGKIKIVRNFMQIKIFSMWRQFTKFKKREVKRQMLNEKLKFQISMYKNNITKKYNEIKYRKEEIEKWFINNKIIQTEIISKDNCDSIMNEFYDKIAEICEILKKAKEININTNIETQGISSSHSSKFKIKKSEKDTNKNKLLVIKTSPSAVKIKQNINYNSVIQSAKSLIILSSIGLSIIDYASNKIIEQMKKYKYKICFFFDDKKYQQVISYPSIDTVSSLFNKISELIDGNFNKRNERVLEKYFQELIKEFQNNEKSISEIKEYYMNLLTGKGIDNFSLQNQQDIITNGKMINDFSQLNHQIIKNETIIIDQKITDLENKLLSNDCNIQEMKYVLLDIDNKLSLCNITNSLIDNKIKKVKAKLEAETQSINKNYSMEYIENKIDEISDSKNIIELISLIKIIMVKYNILYENLDKVLENLSAYFDNFGNKKLNKVPILYDELNQKQKLNYKFIHFKSLYDEFICLMKNQEYFNSNFYLCFYKCLTIRDNLMNEYQQYENKKELVNMYFEIMKFENTIVNYKLLFKQKICKIEEKDDTTSENKKDERLNYILTHQLNYKKLYSKFIEKNCNNENLESILYKLNNNSLSQTENEQIMESLVKYSNNKDKTILYEIRTEMLEKKFNDYLVNISKGLGKNSNSQYPSMFLLPKEELISLIKKPASSIKQINEVISQYYTKINSNQQLILSKNKIIGIRVSFTSIFSESFLFSNTIQIPPNSGSTKNQLNSLFSYLSLLFSRIDHEISSSLIEQTLTSLSEFSSKSFHSWLNTSISQVSINSLCLIFTNEVSQLLTNSSSQDTSISSSSKKKKSTTPESCPKKKLELIINKYSQWLREDNKIIGPFKNNIILTLINHINIIETLIEKNVYDANSFEWLKYIRHLWDQNKKEVIIECGGWTNYQLKKISSHSRILLSPDTDKIFLFNSSSFREKSASIIKINNNRYNNNLSYQQIFEEFCSLFWTEMIVINANSTPLSSIKNIFDIASSNKYWIYMEGIDSLNRNVNGINYLVYLSKFMQVIQQEVILNDIKSDENEKMFCLMGCILIDNDIKRKEACLKSSSRVLSFIKPDINFYVQVMMKFNDKENNNNPEQIRKIISLINRNEDNVRKEVGSFYYDFDFYDEMMKFLIQNNTGKNFLSNITTFVNIYSNLFFQKNFQMGLNREMVINFFQKKNILYSEIHVELFKYLNMYYTTNKNFILKKPVIHGLGKSFIVDEFNSFFIKKSNPNKHASNIIVKKVKNLSEVYSLQDISFKEVILIDEEINEKNENCKYFSLPLPKRKKLLKSLLSTLNQKMTNMNIIVNDEYQLTLIDFIHSTLKSQEKEDYYISLKTFYKWINLIIDNISSKNKNDTYTIGNVFCIVTQAILLTFKFSQCLVCAISSFIKDSINSKLSDFVLSNYQGDGYILLNLSKLTFDRYISYNDYTINLINFIESICEHKNNILFVINEFYANTIDMMSLFPKNKFIEYNRDYNQNNEGFFNYVIGGNKDNDYGKKLQICIGTSDSNFDDNSSFNTSIFEILKKIYGKKPDERVKLKLNYLLSQTDTNKLTKDDIYFLYHIMNNSANSTPNFENLSNINSLLKLIIKSFPKSNYKLSTFRLIKHILLSQVFCNCKCIDEGFSNDNCINIEFNDNIAQIYLSQYLTSTLSDMKLIKDIISKIKLENEVHPNFINLNHNDIQTISIMLVDFYSNSENVFNEKYQKENYVSLIKTLTINLIIRKQDYDYYTLLQSRMLSIHSQIQILIYYLKYDKIDSSVEKHFFSNKLISNSQKKEIETLILSTLDNYKYLISDKNEFINSNSFYISLFNNFNPEHHKNNNNIINYILEKTYLGLSNHFLFALLLTFEIMSNNFEISNEEINYILPYLKENFIFPSDNSIKFKYESIISSTNEIHDFILEKGKKLINFYKLNASPSSSFFDLLTQSVLPSATKYFYTNNVSKIERDVDKLLFYLTFIPEQSPSIFKYLITKYLIPIYSITKFTVNAFLKQQILYPITIKAEPSINITNFLCSLAAYYEIQFFIVRKMNFDKENAGNTLVTNYKYIVEDNLSSLIKEGITKGYWIFISEEIDIVSLMKVIYELKVYSKNVKINNHFKLFLDQKLVQEDCKKYIEKYTMMLQIENENIEDLEAAHDIWVNVLEEKILTASLMDETQKDFLEVNSNLGKNNVSDLTEVPDNINNFTSHNNNILSNLGFSNNTSGMIDLNLLGNF